MRNDRPLLIASQNEETSRLATSLDAEFVSLPDLTRPEIFEAWRATTIEGDVRERVIVSVWPPPIEARDLAELDANAWAHRFEEPYLLWNFALGAATKLVADGGHVVALCQAPAALDAPGRTPELAIADGVLALVRSIAAAEGRRGVRANLVTTPLGLVEGDLVAPAPPLEGFPGTIEAHVVGAVRIFLSADAEGLTGRVLSADGGRAL